MEPNNSKPPNYINTILFADDHAIVTPTEKHLQKAYINYTLQPKNTIVKSPKPKQRVWILKVKIH